MTKRKDILNDNMIDRSKNSDANINYYEQLVNFFTQDNSDPLMKLRSFALYSPRQVINDFLVRYELFKKILDVPGSIMEFGVFNGQGLMSYAHFSAIMEPNNISRKVFGFDTFDGFEGLTKGDSKGSSPFLKKKGFRVDSFSRINESIRLFDMNRFIGHVKKIDLIKGDVTKTLDGFLKENPHIIISLLYLDMDIYKPTKFVLKKLISRVPKGGIVAFDELNLKEYPGETLALIETLGIGNVELKRIPFCSRISYFVR